MTDEFSPEARQAMRSALKHMESQAPQPPPLPSSSAARQTRGWPRPAVVSVAFFIAALIALPGLWWLRSNVTGGPATTSTAAPTSTTTIPATVTSEAVVPSEGAIEFRRATAPTGGFTSVQVVETAPSQGGGTLGGTSGVRVAALVDSPEGLVAVGHEQIGLRSTAAVWNSLDGGLSWQRVFNESLVFGGIDHPIGDVIPSGLSMTAVAYHQGQFVALGNDTIGIPGPVAWVSDDGRNWTRVPAEAGPQRGRYTTVTGLVATSSGFVAVGSDTSPSGDPMAVTTLVWTSADGESWQTADAAFGDDTPSSAVDLTLIDGRLVAVGSSSESNISPDIATVWVSADATTWERAEVIDATGDPSAYTYMVRVIATPTGGLAIGWSIASQSGSDDPDVAIWTTTDGATWIRVSTAALNDELWAIPEAVASGPGGIVAIVHIDQPFDATLQPSSSIWISSDGLTWEQFEATPYLGRASDMAVVSGRYVAVGSAPGAQVGDDTFWDGAVWIGDIEEP